MFRLLYLEVDSHPILKGININFTEEDKLDINDDIYTSVFIGQNGTGKSEILSFIASVFRNIDNLKCKKTDKFEISHHFRLIYRFDNDIYEISTDRIQPSGNGRTKRNILISFFKNKPYKIEIAKKMGFKNIFSELKENRKYEIKIKDLLLPERILACSIMLTDKFNSKSTESYRYLGVRNEGSPQVAGTKALIRRTVDFIIESLKEPYFIKELKGLLSFLELQESLSISYIPRYKSIFLKGNLTIDDFNDYFINWQKSFKNRKEKPWGYNHFMRIKNDTELVEKIVVFLNDLSGKLETYGSRGKYFSYDILNNTDIADDFDMIKQLDYLNLIAYPSISIKKKDKPSYNLERSSSGETHFVTSMIGLLASIKQNSLIFIDEPEISLHPDWQMKYINQLKKTFKSFSTSHFLIATHSHFMISDLEPNTSSLIILSLDAENKIIAESIEAETYGWSVDEILYKVFKVRSTRNIFFENKLRELAYTMTREPENKIKISEILGKIESYVISEEDPLNKIIYRAKKLI